MLLINVKNGKTRDDFQKFDCRTSCYSVYPQEECIINLARGQQESMKCSFITFPSHPQTRFRSPCGTVLLKTNKTSSGKTYIYPRLTYCYRSVVKSLQNMLLRPQFFRMCEMWKEGVSEVGTYGDIHHGKLCKDFLNYKGQPF